MKYQFALEFKTDRPLTIEEEEYLKNVILEFIKYPSNANGNKLDIMVSDELIE